MLTHVMLKALERSMRDEYVLSIYLDGGGSDVASRTLWRALLDRGLQSIASGLPDGGSGERATFARATANLRRLIPQTPTGALGAPGWVGFASATETLHVEVTPNRIATGLWWGKGFRVSPYLRVLRASHHALAVLVDGRAARLFRCRAGDATIIDRFHSHGEAAAPPESENADTALRPGRERMLDQLATRIVDVNIPDEWIVIGGAPVAARAAAERLVPLLRDRVLLAQHLHRSTTDRELYRAVQDAIDEVMRSREHGEARAIIEGRGAFEPVQLGWLAVRQALEAGGIRRLLISQRFLDERADDAEQIVRLALEHDARPVLLEPPASRVLDAGAAGIAGLGAPKTAKIETPVRGGQLVRS